MEQHEMDAYYIPSSDFHDSEDVEAYFGCRAFISGFTGSAGVMVVTKDFSGLWTDGRYFVQAKKQLKADAMAGIAVPDRFFSMLRAHDLEINPIPLPDHYSFTKNPFAESKADLIFITEKDAVKCRKHPEIKNDERIYVVPLETQLDKFLVDFIEKKITAASERYKTNNH